MRKPYRPAILLLCALSFAVAAFAVVLWIRARHVAGRDRLSFRIARRPYALRCDARGISLIGLSAGGPTDAADEARALAGRIRNQQARWFGSFQGVRTASALRISCTAFQRATRIEGWSWLSSQAAAGPLLEALEDPERFVAAHHLLGQVTGRPAAFTARPLGSDGAYVADDDGLPVEVTRPGPKESPGDARSRVEDSDASVAPKQRVTPVRWSATERYAPGGAELAQNARIDPAHIPRLVKMWYDRLGVRYASAPYWAVMLAGFPAPAFFAWRAGRRRRRTRRGLCGGCGYDLKASPDRCPECGQPVRDGVAGRGPVGMPPNECSPPVPRWRSRRRVAAALGAFLLTGLVALAVTGATRPPTAHGATDADSFAAQTRRDEQRLAALMARIRDVASLGAWLQQAPAGRRWRDPVIESALSEILTDVGNTAGRQDLALPVGFDEVNASEGPARGPSIFEQNLHVVRGDDVRILRATKSILLVDGNVQVAYADDCVIVARGAVTVVEGWRNVIVAGHYVHVSSDGSTSGRNSTASGSVLVSGSVLNVLHAQSSLCRAPRLVRVDHAGNATFVDCPVIQSSTETGSKRFRRARFIVPAEPKVNPLEEVIRVTGVTGPYEGDGRRIGAAVLKASGAELTLRWGAAPVSAHGSPVPALDGWAASMIDAGYVLLSNGEQDAEFFAPAKPH
jgi:hypothetical protein